MISILKKVQREFENPWSELDLYHQAIENPNNFRIKRLQNRIEKRTIGNDIIPKIGAVLTYRDNEWYCYNKESLKNYPELDENGISMIIEIVIDIIIIGDNNAELVIRRYLIKEK